MRFAAIYFELPVNRATEPVVRYHSAHGALDQQFRMTRTTGAHIFRFVPPNVTGKAHETLLLLFLAGDADLFGIDHDYEIAGIDMGRENRFLLTAQKLCRLHRDATKHLIFGIDQPPFALNIGCFGGKSLHWRLKKGTEATGL